MRSIIDLEVIDPGMPLKRQHLAYYLALIPLLALMLLWFFSASAQSATTPLFAISDSTNGGDCSSIGSWDPASKTCTQTLDINVDAGYDAGVAITSPGITFDGNGHTIKALGSGPGTNPVGVEAGVFSGTISGVTIRNLIITGFDSALTLNNCTTCTITNNTLSGNGYGMQLNGTFSSTISGNTTNDNNIASIPNTGIYLSGSSGNIISSNFAAGNGSNMELVDSSDSNTISGNVFSSSLDSSGNPGGGNGISLLQSNVNVITGNVINWNGSGVNLVSGNGNLIHGNTLSSNNQFGLSISSANNSEIYNNNFIDNATQAVNYGSGNSFSKTARTGGNFWSDWATPDTDGDGFVDSPFSFTGGSDILPWATQSAWLDTAPPTVSNVLPAGTISTTSTTVSADYSDTQSGINVATLHITLDGAEITSGCSVTTSNASCARTGLTQGHHTIGGSVRDLSGNEALISGGFDVPSPAKTITSFSITGQLGVTTIDEGAHTIALTMPYGTDVSALAPTISITGASVNPSSGAVHDFTGASTYTVTAADTSTVDYTVMVNVADAESVFSEKYIALAQAPGEATSPATAIPGGMFKNYSNGRLYYNQSTSLVYWVHGGLLIKYDLLGREAGVLGLPTSDEQSVTGVADAQVSNFTNGRIYWGLEVGTFAMTDSEIIAAYDAPPPGAGSGPAYFGLPTSDVYNAWDGRAQNMQKSIFTTNIRNGAHYVRGGVMVKYQMTGGPAGYLHLIMNEEAALDPELVSHPDAVAAIFENGRVYWSGTTGSHIVNGGVYVKYWGYCDATGCGPSSRLGLPITDEYPLALPGGGARSRFEHGFISWWIYYGSWVDVT